MDKSEKKPYGIFQRFVFRTPYIPFQEFIENLQKLDADESYWKEFLCSPSLQEPIFLASPVLHEEIGKFLEGKITSPKAIDKLKMSVLRYYVRMSTRCTPFGLFAGFSVGAFGNEIHICINDTKAYKRATRLDMHYLCSLAQTISKIKIFSGSLKYYPNNSIYRVGEKLRLIEYFYKQTRRIHNIISVEYSEYLGKILHGAISGATINELSTLIEDEDISREEAVSFIKELIDSQILISELDPTVTGESFLVRLEEKINNLPGEEELKSSLRELLILLLEVDKNITGEAIHYYSRIEDIVKKLGVPYEAKLLFQTDMHKPICEAALNKNIQADILDAMELMNKITFQQPETHLTRFAENYYERYEDKEMPLLQVLDSEMGIGYGQEQSDISPLLNGFVLPGRQSVIADLKWNRVQSVLLTKVLKAYQGKDYSIQITEKDFDFLKANWRDLPTTMSGICQFFSSKESKPLMYMHGIGGSSAANLLGRFCHVTAEMEDYAKEITSYEQTLEEDALLAEIVHLPESRIGNILSRPVLRAYEIPYLCKPGVEQPYQIPTSDIYVSVQGRRIFLRSKKWNKRIVPRLSTAHNFSNNSMPVYHFLCDMQTEGLRSGIGFYWGSLEQEFEFLPRAMYKDIILSLAKWKIKTEEIERLLGIERKGKNGAKSDTVIHSVAKKEDILKNVLAWRKDKQIPRFVMFPEGDNTLFIDMENHLSLLVLYSAIKKRSIFSLEEFPFEPHDAIVKDTNGGVYTNEFIFGFQKNVPENKN